MSNLIDCYNNNYIDYNKLFTHHFGSVPSILFVEIEQETSKENMANALDLLNFGDEFEVELKLWNINYSNNPDPASNFSDRILYRSKTKKCLFWVSLRWGGLNLTIHYDCKDLELEKWCLSKIQLLKDKLSPKKMPSFKIVTIGKNGFETNRVHTDPIEIDIENNYNNDFSEFNRKVNESINMKKSGVIMFHGEPGTGKTSYIKSLISNNQEIDFIFIQNDIVSTLLKPNFISFLVRQKNSVLIIEDAEKVIASREDMTKNSVVSNILQLTDGLFSDFLNIKIICTFNTSLSNIDTALLRKGRLMAMYEFKKLDKEKTNKLLNRLGYEGQNEPLTISEIFNFEEKGYTPAKKKKIGFSVV